MEKELQISTQLVCRYFGVEIGEGKPSYDRILEQLTKQVSQLLNHDFQALLNALYRIDVDERLFGQALELSAPEDVSIRIAQLILDRIILKAKTRIKYSE